MLVKLILLFATIAGIGAAEVEVGSYDSVEECQAAVGEMTAWVDGDVKVTYHCVER